MITLRQNNQDKLIAGTYSYATETLSPTVISGTIHAYRFGNVVQIFATSSAAATLAGGLPAPEVAFTSNGLSINANGELSCSAAVTNAMITYITED